MIRRRAGQSLMEYAVMVGVVAVAVTLVATYVKRAFTSHARAIEREATLF
jgi:Flp pilus assembly pilin Flp